MYAEASSFLKLKPVQLWNYLEFVRAETAGSLYSVQEDQSA